MTHAYKKIERDHISFSNVCQRFWPIAGLNRIKTLAQNAYIIPKYGYRRKSEFY